MSQMEREDLGDFNLPPLEKILLETLPSKSISLYLKEWKDFTSKIGLNQQTIPSEEDYLRYFNYLRTERKLKGSSLWSIYSRLNAVHQRRFGKTFSFLFATSDLYNCWCFSWLGQRLQTWPRLKKYIESCRAGERVKKADVFSYDELLFFAQNRNYSTKYWLVRKAVIAFAYFGGHRTCELRCLKLSSVKIVEDGVEVLFPRAKQRREVKVIFFPLDKTIRLFHCFAFYL